MKKEDKTSVIKFVIRCKVKIVLFTIATFFTIGLYPSYAQSLKAQSCNAVNGPEYRIASWNELKSIKLLPVHALDIAQKLKRNKASIVNCRLRSLDTGFKSAVEDLENYFKASNDDYVRRVMGYGTDSLVFIVTSNQYELLATIGRKNLQSILKIPSAKINQYAENSSIGYTTSMIKDGIGSVQTVSGKQYKYEIHNLGGGNIEVYYQKKNGGPVYTAECINEGLNGASSLLQTMSRDIVNFYEEWKMHQCASFCTSNSEHRKKCKKSIGGNYQDTFLYQPDP